VITGGRIDGTTVCGFIAAVPAHAAMLIMTHS
jgi:hypothetical protein